MTFNDGDAPRAVFDKIGKLGGYDHVVLVELSRLYASEAETAAEATAEATGKRKTQPQVWTCLDKFSNLFA